MFDLDLQKELEQLGHRLKQARLAKGDSQKDFAFRIKVSIPTLRKMETGSPQVAIGTWVSALKVLGHAADLNQLIAPKKSLAERYKFEQQIDGRQRAKRKR